MSACAMHKQPELEEPKRRKIYSKISQWAHTHSTQSARAIRFNLMYLSVATIPINFIYSVSHMYVWGV